VVITLLNLRHVIEGHIAEATAWPARAQQGNLHVLLAWMEIRNFDWLSSRWPALAVNYRRNPSQLQDLRPLSLLLISRLKA